MRILALVLAPVAALMLALPLQAQDAPSTISVTGEGTVDMQPDMATVTLGARSEAGTAAEALARSSAAVAAALEVLSGAGVAAEDIQTSGLNLSPRWERDSAGGNRPPRLAGYVASNTLNVRVRDLDALGGILDAVVAGGANSLGGLRFGLSEPRAAMDDARRAAVADARARAELYADAAGVTLGQVRLIAEEGGFSPAPRMMMDTAMAESAVPVAPGELSVTARVRVVFAISE